MMNADDFRRLALALPGAEEGAHMGHPDFRANGRIFASLHQGDATGMVKLAPEEQAEFVRLHPEVFAPASGAWGRQGSTIVTLAAAGAPVIRTALTMAYEQVMAAPEGRLARRPSRTRTRR